MTRSLALTAGDPGGIGFDIALAAWSARREHRLPPFYLLARTEAVRLRAEKLGLTISIADTNPADAHRCFDRSLPIVALKNPQDGEPGGSLASNAAATIESIDRAVADTMAGAALAVVTLPIAKKPLHDAGFAFAGHTEYLAHLAERHAGGSITPVMMLAGPKLRAVPVTVHVALADVPRLLTQELIVETCQIAAVDLQRRFGLKHPRLAVSGLNPHAGENGAFGLEDETIIQPAIAVLQSEGLDVTGPLPADTMFHAEARQRYDAAICMYHDQALIPAKALDFERTVNVTLGLPFVRTSPDHGTAFALAGTGGANPQSLIEALRLAAKLAGNGGPV